MALISVTITPRDLPSPPVSPIIKQPRNNLSPRNIFFPLSKIPSTSPEVNNNSNTNNHEDNNNSGHKNNNINIDHYSRHIGKELSRKSFFLPLIKSAASTVEAAVTICKLGGHRAEPSIPILLANASLLPTRRSTPGVQSLADSRRRKEGKRRAAVVRSDSFLLGGGGDHRPSDRCQGPHDSAGDSDGDNNTTMTCGAIYHDTDTARARNPVGATSQYSKSAEFSASSSSNGSRHSNYHVNHTKQNSPTRHRTVTSPSKLTKRVKTSSSPARASDRKKLSRYRGDRLSGAGDTEFFTLSFRDETEETEESYDPDSELRSSYYTIRKVKMPHGQYLIDFHGDDEDQEDGFRGCLSGVGAVLHTR